MSVVSSLRSRPGVLALVNEQADAFVAATRGDNRNALASQIAKHVFQIERVGSVIFDPEREQVYRQLGLRTINPTKLEAGLLRELIEEPEGAA